MPTETIDAASDSSTVYSIGSLEFFTGRLDGGGDRDWIALKIDGTGKYAFTVRGTGAFSDMLGSIDGTVYDSNGAIVAGGNIASPGTYYLEVATYGDQGGEYTVAFGEGSRPIYNDEMAASNLIRSSPWNTPPAPTTISWSVRTDFPNMRDALGRITAFDALTEDEAVALARALSLFSDVAGMTFNRVNPGGTSNDGSIRFSSYSAYDDGAVAFTHSYAVGPVFDVQFNRAFMLPSGYEAGNHSTFVFMHEIGHALGLAHPTDYDMSGDFNYYDDAGYRQDSQRYTVMSYFEVSYPNGQKPQTLLMHDIRAIQKIYGANTATRADDTVYGFNPTLPGSLYDFATNDNPALCIWDGGGADTIDLSGARLRQTINLEQGGFSDVGEGTANVSIAIGAIIENAIGGSQADTLLGNGGANRLTGNDGNDIFNGGFGRDTIDGGRGRDTADYSTRTSRVEVALNGSSSAIAKVGGVDEDELRNIEILVGSIRADTLTGDGLANTFRGGPGADTLDGGGGNDTADYSEKRSIVLELKGSAFAVVKINDVTIDDSIRNIENIIGGRGDNRIIGDDRDNMLVGAGHDTLSGGSGNDTLRGNGFGDTLDGGNGNDTVDYSYLSKVDVTLRGSTTVTVFKGSERDLIKNFENVLGGRGGDSLTGDALANFFRGNAGRDTIDGAGGSDTADYSDKGRKVEVALNGSTAVTVTVGGKLEDTIKNIENVIGGDAGDSIAGDDLGNSLAGNAGNDTLTGGLGRDVLFGGADDDRFVFSTVGDSGVASATRDVIGDFTHGDDKIDLSAIDANTTVAGNQAFELLTMETATSAVTKGKIGWYWENHSGTARDKTIIHLNNVGDSASDMQIELKGLITLTSADFVL